MIFLFLSSAVFVFFGILLSISDIKTLTINVFVNFAGILLLLILIIVFHCNTFSSIIGSVVLTFLFIFVYFFSGKKLGTGDIYYGIFCGLYLGFPLCLFVGILTSLTGGLYIFIRNFISARLNKSKISVIPLIPFLFFSSFLLFLLNSFFHFPII